MTRNFNKFWFTFTDSIFVFDEHTRTDQHNALLLVNMYCIKNLSISKNYSMLFKNFIYNKEW